MNEEVDDHNYDLVLPDLSEMQYEEKERVSLTKRRRSTTTIEDLIADGRIRTHPYQPHFEPTILEIDFDLMCTRLCTILKQVYLCYDPLHNRYSGTASAIDSAIDGDVEAMVDFALFIAYNRLRSICKHYSSTVLAARCNPRAPVSTRMVFPTWLSSLLGSIGPLRISNGPVDKLVIYVPLPNTMNNYGRATVRSPVEGRYNRLVTNLGDAGIGLTPIDMNAPLGSYWTTCAVKLGETGLISVLGTVHPSYYTNDDFLHAAVLYSDRDLNPFQPGDDEPTLAIPTDQTENSAGCPVAMHSKVNCCGILPAVAQSSGTDASAHGVYVISGGGNEHVYTCYLAEHITAYDLHSCLRTALLQHGASA